MTRFRARFHAQDTAKLVAPQGRAFVVLALDSAMNLNRGEYPTPPAACDWFASAFASRGERKTNFFPHNIDLDSSLPASPARMKQRDVRSPLLASLGCRLFCRCLHTCCFRRCRCVFPVASVFRRQCFVAEQTFSGRLDPCTVKAHPILSARAHCA